MVRACFGVASPCCYCNQMQLSHMVRKKSVVDAFFMLFACSPHAPCGIVDAFYSPSNVEVISRKREARSRDMNPQPQRGKIFSDTNMYMLPCYQVKKKSNLNISKNSEKIINVQNTYVDNL